VPGINQTGYRKLKQSFPGGTEASPRTGKLFGQGNQESCTNEERKRTALEQKGKLAYLAGPPPGMRDFSHPRSGHDITIFLRKLFQEGWLVAHMPSPTHHAGLRPTILKVLYWGRTTGTVEHDSANTKVETASSPEQSIVE
jgi:hypothetical protein